ncbi:MAG: signal peptidase II [Rhodospirillales bacterium]|jgi:signal peptidase II|nr:signal peptidase II [Rhodospirillales bacterium]MDP7652226.1 signal peptidase II [Rhodospirillales bacterium]HJO97621.1 signal peptidase II [Rhodospirillales bacterium]
MTPDATRTGSAPRVGIAAATLVVALDQASKWWMLDHVMRPPRVIELTGFFNLVMGWNRGVSFGLFNTSTPYNAWVLSALALIIVAVLAVWLGRTRSPLLAAAIGLIIGGALGNVIDRVRFGAVFDFLDIHAAGFHWPAFNVADSAITVGAVMLVVDSLFARPENYKHKGDGTTGSENRANDGP